MEITELTDQQCAEWDHYICSSPHGLPQHLSGWRTVMQKTYGYKMQYLLAKDKVGKMADGMPSSPKIVGVLPLFFVKSILTGNRAMTMPGALCADNEQVAQALIEQGRAVAEKAGAQRLFLQDSRQCWPGQVESSQRHVAWQLDVRGSLEEVEKRLDRNIRRQIRMAQRNGLTVEISSDPKLIAPFYQVWSRFTHAMGTPVFGQKFLETIAESFPNQFNVAIVYRQTQPIGGYFQLQMGDTVYGVWGATLHEFLELRPVYLAYWEMMTYAQRNGYQMLDMGRSPLDSTASAFKAQWGGVSTPVYQQVIICGKTNQTGAGFAMPGQDEMKFRTFSQLWRKLPLTLTQILGPQLRRHIPFA